MPSVSQLAFSCMSISLALPVDQSGCNSDPGVSVMTRLSICECRYNNYCTLSVYFWYGAVIYEGRASKAARGGAKLLP